MGRLEQTHMRFLEERNEHHASDKSANMCYISHIGADLPQICKLQYNPATKYEKCRYIHHPEKYKNADNAANVRARMKQQISPQHTSEGAAGANHRHLR